MKKKLKIKTAKKDSTLFLKQKSASYSKKVAKFLVANALIQKDHVDLVSKILDRNINQEIKDTDDYNIKFISKSDSHAYFLMSAGIVNDFRAGDSIKVDAMISKYHYNNDIVLKAFLDLMEKKNYESFPFRPETAADLRVRYLLKTSKDDSFISMLSQMDQLHDLFMSDEDWNDLTDCMTEAEYRLKKEKVLFMDPYEHGVMGKLRSISSSEMKEYHKTQSTIMIDERHDYHDLVALKEFLLCMQGNSVETTSIFAGAFAKYIPELNKRGIRGVVCLVEDNKLKQIKLSRYNGEKIIPFGPVEAAVALVDTFPVDETKPIGLNQRYYVTVNGAVAAPSNKSYSYKEEFPINDMALPAAETFLFNKDQQTHDSLCTRLYFYAYSPAKLALEHQNMTVVFGDSDQMFNSCALQPGSDENYTDQIKKDFYYKIMQFGIQDEPAFNVMKKHYLRKSEPPASMVISENKLKSDKAKAASDSLYAENKYTYEKFLKIAKSFGRKIGELATKVENSHLLENALPITSRFVLYNYLVGSDGGLTRDAQLTVYRMFERFDYGKVLSDLKRCIETGQKIEKLNQLYDSGLSMSEAYQQAFGEGLKNFLEKTGTDKKKD